MFAERGAAPFGAGPKREDYADGAKAPSCGLATGGCRIGQNGACPDGADTMGIV